MKIVKCTTVGQSTQHSCYSAAVSFHHDCSGSHMHNSLKWWWACRNEIKFPHFSLEYYMVSCFNQSQRLILSSPTLLSTQLPSCQEVFNSPPFPPSKPHEFGPLAAWLEDMTREEKWSISHTHSYTHTLSFLLELLHTSQCSRPCPNSTNTPLYPGR